MMNSRKSVCDAQITEFQEGRALIIAIVLGDDGGRDGRDEYRQCDTLAHGEMGHSRCGHSGGFWSSASKGTLT